MVAEAVVLMVAETTVENSNAIVEWCGVAPVD